MSCAGWRRLLPETSFPYYPCKPHRRGGYETVIVAEQKPLEDLKRMMKGKKKVLAVGCGTCVSVCFSGGKKETGGLASALQTAAAVDGETLEVVEKTVQRQCVQEFVEPLDEDMEEYDAVLSLGCGVGVQTMAERYPETRILSGLDTQFMGQPTEPGVWEERCVGCGNCVLEYTGGLCPITRCPKQLFNGPCGGSENGMCEVDTSLPCVWSMIWDNAENLELTDTLMEIQPPQDWSTSRSGGLRRTVVRDDLFQPSAVGKDGPPAPKSGEAEPDSAAGDTETGSREDAFLKEMGLA